MYVMANHPLTERLYKAVGERVRVARKGVDVTQDTLARLIGSARTSITNLELGKQHVPLHQLLAIADVLKVDLRELIPTVADLAGTPPVPMIVSGVPQGAPPRAQEWIDSMLSQADDSAPRAPRELPETSRG
jgi:transcriptional regulator with XRE-family HTH domain